MLRLLIPLKLPILPGTIVVDVAPAPDFDVLVVDLVVVIVFFVVATNVGDFEAVDATIAHGVGATSDSIANIV